MQTIAVANHKGGIGKTTIVRTVGQCLAERRRVLLVDLDPQASLTGACVTGDVGRTLADVMGSTQAGQVPMRDVLIELSPTLSLVPSAIDLAGTELGLNARMGRESVLAKALATVAAGFDVCMIDCPPSLGLLTVNGLTAAHGVLIPTQPQAVDVKALRLFLDTLDYIRAELNPALEIVGIVATFYDGRLTHHQAVMQTMRDAGLPLVPVTIGRSVRVAEAAAIGQDVTTFDPDNPQAQAYRDLTGLIDTWLGRNRQK